MKQFAENSRTKRLVLFRRRSFAKALHFRSRISHQNVTRTQQELYSCHYGDLGRSIWDLGTHFYPHRERTMPPTIPFCPMNNALAEAETHLIGSRKKGVSASARRSACVDQTCWALRYTKRQPRLTWFGSATWNISAVRDHATPCVQRCATSLRKGTLLSSNPFQSLRRKPQSYQFPCFSYSWQINLPPLILCITCKTLIPEGIIRLKTSSFLFFVLLFF